ncbi:hypothetical protein A2574_03265 [Candidatus Shapirobacteria bacterium RIFOXYD1_FULL_38_32]|nr:MAG: hypothetical protein A2367_01695 [Candidatus Shapirobacteria bacterium RIFOXYB1_FULL_38_38]OGL57517.1 MAG: hypothetical protein A2410_03500 [Candidatus Shapirobacteria bacterium RIFOXYC1_FULL_38_24]OGL58072.1 MAG: hypothetical protein A2574_03265 [Candidatus Shapirobacteria bacterium RIFOXYD1_FULL_38_32]HAP37377.1 hypothetical protein [Candidatus Shapirobacteria bacterium]HCU55075.1 hypothetical protein [Candidatus Shapirobacteria bacterium]
MFFTFSSTLTLAKNDKVNPSNQPKPTQIKAKYLDQTIQKIEVVKPKVKTPQVKEELEQIQAEQIESDKTIDSSLNKISTRSGLAKLVIGPDYKNAGAVRSEIVHLQNQVRQLTRLESKASTSEKTAIQESISSLNEELLAIETRLNESLKGFSLFGWLNKLLTGFVSPVSTPEITPTITPDLSVTPSVVPTIEPTIVPTLTPTTTP